MAKLLAATIGLALCLASNIGATAAERPKAPAVPAAAQPTISLMGPGLLVHDLEAAARFYRDGLGLKEAGRFQSSVMNEVAFAFGPDKRPPFLMLMQRRDHSTGTPHETSASQDKIVLTTSDAATLNARLKAAGYAPGEISENAAHGIKVFWVTDSDGHRFEITERAQAKPLSIGVPDPAPVNPEQVMATAEQLARWQVEQFRTQKPDANPEGPDNPRGWRQATFWLGMAAMAERSQAPWIREALLAHGEANRWMPGPRAYNADDQLVTAVYLWDAANGAGANAIMPSRRLSDTILAAPPRVHLALHLGPDGYASYARAECLKRWCWSDALFMAPASWIALSRQTGDRRYKDYALSEFWAITDFLYDPAERLYFRDSRFFNLRHADERKMFWSRGNGWVFAGIARMIDDLPPRDPARPRLLALFRDMAGRIAALQKPDGFWPSDLGAGGETSPESSGTALFTYGLAWGVRNGDLPSKEYEPAVRRGWSALVASIQPDGSLGWVQPAGDRPGVSSASDSQVYGTGLFLLAASAVADLGLKD